MENKKTVTIKTEYITLGQLLKFLRIVGQGGEEKAYLATHDVLVNGEADNRRGRKLRPGDTVSLDEGEFEIAGQ
ncbi:MAG: S4 domain-containing protein YaaA [Bacilli bacterium]|nr:S4 domain-containing protein YaaA [Bacilli bacterium]